MSFGSPALPSSAREAPLSLSATAERLAESALQVATALAALAPDDRDRRYAATFADLADDLFRLAVRIVEEQPDGPPRPDALKPGQETSLTIVLAQCPSAAPGTPLAQQVAALRTARRVLARQAGDQRRAAHWPPPGSEEHALPLVDMEGNPIDRHDLGARFYAAHMMEKARRAANQASAPPEAAPAPVAAETPAMAMVQRAETRPPEPAVLAPPPPAPGLVTPTLIASRRRSRWETGDSSVGRRAPPGEWLLP